MCTVRWCVYSAVVTNVYSVYSALVYSACVLHSACIVYNVCSALVTNVYSALVICFKSFYRS